MPKTEPEPGLISTKQMRELHAALHEHGISGDAATHAYITRALEEMGAEPVESRTELSTVHAAKIISDLHAEPPSTSSRMTPSKLRALRADFDGAEMGKLPRSTCKACSNAANKRCENHNWVTNCPECRGSHSSATMHIDFVGHADVTARLLSVDPEWWWEPFSPEEVNALPPKYREGLWIWLHVLGVKRAGFGHAENDRQRGGDEVKVAIGDALRNAAMRFGVALDLWAKGDRAWSDAAKADGYENPPMDPTPPREPVADQAPRTWNGPSTETLLAQLDEAAQRAGVTYEVATQRFRDARDGMSLDGLEKLPPWELAPLVDAVAKRADEVVAEREAAAAASDQGEKPATGDEATADPSDPDDPWAAPTGGTDG